ncbi:MAG: hypothetical protein QOC77_238 [Thermoleophilaceae bacterium]|nr:hypothetical protein [Thermoleophilaceae bacterium]MEA2470292.1 hypothetical protein [Thermoleophilaceae bacterium]
MFASHYTLYRLDWRLVERRAYDGPTPSPRSKETVLRRPFVLLIAVVALVAVAVPALAASEGDVNVPAKFKSLLPKVKKKSGLAVRLPSKIHVFVKPSRAYPGGSATKKSYFLELDAVKGCNGANACFLASFSGERGGKPSFKKKVSLTHGITGYFRPVTCGASCAPAFIQWKEGKVLYEIENKGVTGSEKASMVKLANSAITGGNR